jgi:YidC/Oxa1 family membrane protein insertase
MVVFTIMVRLVLTPLDFKSRVSMRKTQKLAPQQQALQKKYANDKEKLNQKMSELYKKEHVNPLSSCLPMLLTWPILIAVFGAMRLAANKQLLEQVGQILAGQQPSMEPWLWIKNLWMPDNFFSSALPDFNTLRSISTDEWVKWFNSAEIQNNMPALLKSLNLTEASFQGSDLQKTVEAIVEAMKTLPFYAEGVATIPGYTVPLVNWSVPQMYNGFLLLPILSAVSQIVMTKIMGGNQPAAEGQPNTGKFMQWFFPIFSLWICLGYSAAFALYWVSGNLVSMGQTYAINKYLDAKEQKAAPVAGEGSVK